MFVKWITEVLKLVTGLLSESCFPIDSACQKVLLSSGFATRLTEGLFFSLLQDFSSNLAFLITLFIALLLFSLILVFVCMENIFQRCTRLFSAVIWTCLITMGYVFIFVGGVVCAWDQVSFFLFIIFIVYTMLPVGMKDAVVAGIIASLSHIIVLSIYLSMGNSSHSQLQLANLVIFVCGNLVGAYHKHLMEVALGETFHETFNLIQSRVKLESEKRHQEHLLLSILPAYIALEMKTEIIERLRDGGQPQRQHESANNFHNLYVKRHQNVSILYADIVGFTLLASECSPKELVLMLNELFGKFDQIAKDNDCMRIKILELLRLIIAADDINMTNHMEAGGVPGRVHITEATLSHLGGMYTVEEVCCVRDSYLRENRIKTFLVVDPRPWPGEHLPRFACFMMRASVRMTRYLESWGAAKPFANLKPLDNLPAEPSGFPIESPRVKHN
uniref:adenylate cyclase n=1 Tax=Naja naja TaxID=35670 RepID=A0A8C6XMA7_NAJNA